MSIWEFLESCFMSYLLSFIRCIVKEDESSYFANTLVLISFGRFRSLSINRHEFVSWVTFSCCFHNKKVIRGQNQPRYGLSKTQKFILCCKYNI